MLIFNRAIVSLACLGMLGVSFNVRASGAVAGATEITQILNNGQLFMQVVEAKNQTVTQIKQLYELYKSAEREIQHLKAIGSDVARLAALAKEKDLNNLLKMIDLTENVYGNAKDLSKRIEVRYQEAYNQGLSIKDYMLSEGKKLERKEKAAVAKAEQEKNIVQHLKEDLDDIADLAQKIPLTEGTQQSLGLMNVQFNKMLTAMNRLGQIVQAGQENAKKATEEAEAATTERHAKKFAEDVQKMNDQTSKSTGIGEFDPLTGARINAKTTK